MPDYDSMARRTHYYPTHPAVRQAVSRCTPLITETGDAGMINMSAIYTKLIQDAGRFAERYASDLLYDIKYLDYLTAEHKPEPDEDSIILTAIRRDGVDGMGFFQSRVTNECLLGSLAYGRCYVSTSRVYRRILAVRVRADEERGDRRRPYLIAELFDITDAFIDWTKDDADWNPDTDMTDHVQKTIEAESET